MCSAAQKKKKICYNPDSPQLGHWGSVFSWHILSSTLSKDNIFDVLADCFNRFFWIWKRFLFWPVRWPWMRWFCPVFLLLWTRTQQSAWLSWPPPPHLPWFSSQCRYDPPPQDPTATFPIHSATKTEKYRRFVDVFAVMWHFSFSFLHFRPCNFFFFCNFIYRFSQLYKQQPKSHPPRGTHNTYSIQFEVITIQKWSLINKVNT